MAGVILFLLVVIGWICIRVLLERKKLDQQEMLLDVQARKRNGRVKPGRLGRWTYPTLLLKYKEYDLTISVTPGGRYPPPYTCAKSSIPLPSHIRCALLFKASEMLKLGTSVFDTPFTSQSPDDAFLRAFLTSPIQQQLLRLSKQCGMCEVTIKNNTFEIKIRGIPDSIQEYDQFLDVTLLCLDRLHAGLVRTVFFGTVRSDAMISAYTVVNPEVSALTMPPLAVTQIIIDADSYHFHQLEQFLTYAVNHIGQVYLKNTVEVSVYGNIENLHPNLRNSLTNLCKRLTVYENHDVVIPINSV